MCRDQRHTIKRFAGPFEMAHLAILIAVLVSGLGLAYAQRFSTPVQAFANDSTLTTRDGRELKGHVRRFEGEPLWMMGGISPGVSRIQFQDEDGNREWFNADEIVRLVAKLDALQRLDILDEHTSSIVNVVGALQNEFSEVFEREYTYYEPVETKPGKFQLYQLINPGFDSKIKVFYMGSGTIFSDSSQYKGGISVDGVQIKSPQLVKVLVVKSGGMGMLVKKGKYKKRHFDELFGDCDYLRRYSAQDRKYKYFAEHVFVYDQACE